jgi:hypothetical protein
VIDFYMFETPILFLIFNRPDFTRITFSKIREIKPKYLFVAADGPRDGATKDFELCMESREIVLKMIDWRCELKTLLREKNLGCGKAVSQAITWFFDNVEQGIILEDDILPDLSFFYFCDELLNYYKDNEKVMLVSGFNGCGTWKPKLQSYHFSHVSGIWGWASWRRAWKCYDFYIKSWPNLAARKAFKKNISKKYREQMIKACDQIYKKQTVPDTWDYQWVVATLLNSGLGVVPSVNLIKNIGFCENATHTFDPNHIGARNKVYSIKIPTNKQKRIFVDKKYDRISLNLVIPMRSKVAFIKNKIARLKSTLIRKAEK